MSAISVKGVIAALQQTPFLTKYDRNIILILIPPGPTDPTDYHLLDKLSSVDIADKVSIESAFSMLGFDFGVIIISETQVLLACGPRSLIKLFWQVNGSSLIVRDHLPTEPNLINKANSLNIEAIASFFGSAIATGAFEIRRTSLCINKNWCCVPNSHIISFDVRDKTVGCCAFDNIWNEFADTDTNLSAAIGRARETFSSHLKKLSKLGGICAEVSGGIDSGIVAATAKNALNGGFLSGISCEYPFFEFSREKRFRRDLYNHLNVQAHYEPWNKTIPFAQCDLVPEHDSPSVQSTNWGLYNTMGCVARRHGASVLLTGHGGDRIFLQNPFEKKGLFSSKAAARPRWFPRHLYAASVGEAEDIHAHLCSTTTNGICGQWNGAMFEPGWNERYGSIGTGLTRHCSGYLDREFIRSMANVWRAARTLDKNIQKPIAHLIFPDSLPGSVWHRLGKVNHLGIIYRGVRIWKRELVNITKRGSGVLDAIGIGRKEFVGAMENVGEGHDCANPYITLVIAVLLWAVSDRNCVAERDKLTEIGVDLSGDTVTWMSPRRREGLPVTPFDGCIKVGKPVDSP